MLFWWVDVVAEEKVGRGLVENLGEVNSKYGVGSPAPSKRRAPLSERVGKKYVVSELGGTQSPEVNFQQKAA